MSHNIIFLIALLVIMAALIVFTFVFVILVDRSLNRANESQQDASNSEEST